MQYMGILHSDVHVCELWKYKKIYINTKEENVR